MWFSEMTSTIAAPQSKQTSSTPRKSVLHNSSTSPNWVARHPGSVSFGPASAADPDDVDFCHIVDGSSAASDAASGGAMEFFDSGSGSTANRYRSLVNQLESAAASIGCRGRRAQALMVTTVAVLSYQMAVSDLGTAFHRLCGAGVTLFSIACCFCALALYLRDVWTNTAVYVLFATCFASELVISSVLSMDSDDTDGGGSPSGAASVLLHPISTLVVLAGAGAACLFSPLDASGGTAAVVLVSWSRYLATTMLGDLPAAIRPLLAYAGGLAGVVAARYVETRLTLCTANRVIGTIPDSPVHNAATTMTMTTTTTPTSGAHASHGNSNMKAADLKRRRASSAVTNNNYSSHYVGRRTSLPTLAPKSASTTVVLDATLVREAEGLLTDMMANPDVPRHLVGGLRAVCQIFKSTDSFLMSGGGSANAAYRMRGSPECSAGSSDYVDLPFTERPLYLPKRLRRNLPPPVARCRSTTGSWTTTTSATGMPSLESDLPPRPRSRLSIGGRQDIGTLPSPVSGTGTTSATSCNSSSSQPAGSLPPIRLPSKRLIMTSDYDSSDSPSSSELGDQHHQQHHNNDSQHLQQQGHDDEAGPSRRLSEGQLSNVEHRQNSTTSDGDAGTMLSPQPVFELGLEVYDDGGRNYRKPSVESLRQSSENLTQLSSTSSHVNFSDNIGLLRGNSSGNAAASSSAGSLRSTSSSPGPVDDRTTPQQHSGVVAVDQLGEKLANLLHPPRTPPSDADLNYIDDELQTDSELLSVESLSMWDYQVFNLAEKSPDTLLSRVAFKLFTELGFMSTFNIPRKEFISYFHALELGYRDKPYHNRVHATDVLHATYYMTSQPVPGFNQVCLDDHLTASAAAADTAANNCRTSSWLAAAAGNANSPYGIIGANFPPLELMALYTAAAMHDYDHPGRTNAFLVTTASPLAVLYNDRSVLENHHAAAAWQLMLSDQRFSWLKNLDYAEFKRFRFLVVEAILATDLKRHFDLLAEFNAKVNDETAPGIDWTVEPDRLMAGNMIIKMADINGPCKPKDLHMQWTNRITDEFYEQGDEEAALGLPISPFMNRRQPQLARLQESFINHLVAPLCNALSDAGLLPATILDDVEESDLSSSIDEDEDPDSDTKAQRPVSRKAAINCSMVKNLHTNHDMWVKVIEREEGESSAAEKDKTTSSDEDQREEDTEMEPIKEEGSASTPPS